MTKNPTDPCTEVGKHVPAMVQRALSQRLHSAGRDFILGKQLSSGLKMEETSLTSMNENEETGSNNLTYPPFGCAGQRWAKSIIAVIQIPICFPDDALKDMHGI